MRILVEAQGKIVAAKIPANGWGGKLWSESIVVAGSVQDPLPERSGWARTSGPRMRPQAALIKVWLAGLHGLA